ncbi:outer membrane protein N [Escherichia coli TA008]|nr:outer membrane protein N [Escherichia coli TA008]
MCFFWITALIDIFMKIIITRKYIMKRKVLAMLVPALLVAGAANAAEIYNKDGNKVDFYGKMVGERIWSNTDDNNSENEDTSYARFGVKGETQITSELTGFGQFEYNLDASKPEGENQEKTRLTFAGLKYNELGSFDYAVTTVLLMMPQLIPIC